MNENINLCELLEGHEGETFYSPALGDCKLIKIDKSSTNPIKVQLYDKDYVWFCINGSYYTNCPNDIQLFPSKDQRDWNKWAEEQKHKVPKTWNGLIEAEKVKILGVSTIENPYCSISIVASNRRRETIRETPIEKSALALLKIHQLIDVCYGGNISFEEKLGFNDFYSIIIHDYFDDEKTWEFTINKGVQAHHHIAFHTEQQAEEFLSYPENVQLVKDFCMIN